MSDMGEYEEAAREHRLKSVKRQYEEQIVQIEKMYKGQLDAIDAKYSEQRQWAIENKMFFNNAQKAFYIFIGVCISVIVYTIAKFS